MIEQFKPDAIHIATEGPLGLAARWYCKVEKRSIPHNTSYHTKFPEYLEQHYGLPTSLGYWGIKLFHKFSSRVLVTNQTMEEDLRSRGFDNLAVWNRGVNKTMFDVSLRQERSLKKPVLLCVSRASIEKGLDDFCSLETTGTKIFVGDGPYLDTLKQRYPDVVFVGFKQGRELAEHYANADVFVFPSKSDTFGVVMIESLSCGTPIAAYPVTGPTDIVIEGVNGSMDWDLGKAVERALACDRSAAFETSKVYDWEACTNTFLYNLQLIQSANSVPAS